MMCRLQMLLGIFYGRQMTPPGDEQTLLLLIETHALFQMLAQQFDAFAGFRG